MTSGHTHNWGHTQGQGSHTRPGVTHTIRGHSHTRGHTRSGVTHMIRGHSHTRGHTHDQGSHTHQGSHTRSGVTHTPGGTHTARGTSLCCLLAAREMSPNAAPRASWMMGWRRRVSPLGRCHLSAPLRGSLRLCLSPSPSPLPTQLHTQQRDSGSDFWGEEEAGGLSGGATSLS